MNSLNTQRLLPSLRRRVLLVTACAALAGGATWVVADAKSDSAKPAVSVKVDPAPLVRADDTSYSPIVKRVAPSVVKIVTREQAKQLEGVGSPFSDPRFREFFGPFFGPAPRDNGRDQGRMFRQPPQMGLGSGVIVSPDGYILTNNHVVADADQVKVTLSDGRELDAKVVGKDEKTDLAVIKVDAKDLPAATFAESESVEVGDRVLAVGNPFGLGQTVTTGIVSATSRAVSLGIDYADFIQTDAAINPGNSGGALIDMQGRLVGINTAILSRSGGFQGIGFAIPADLARSILNALVTDGRVVRGYLGVLIQDVTPALAEAMDLGARKGALVSEVNPDSPAEKAGLKSGDVVVKVDGKEIADSRRLKFAIANVKPGEDVKLQVLREGKEQAITVNVGELPGEKQLASANSNDRDDGVLDGVGVTDLNPAARAEFNIPSNVRGALVTEVDPSSAAAEAGLSPGDVIQEINRKPVRSANDAVRLTEKTESPKTLLKLWSRGGTHFLVVDETNRAGSE